MELASQAVQAARKLGGARARTADPTDQQCSTPCNLMASSERGEAAAGAASWLVVSKCLLHHSLVFGAVLFFFWLWFLFVFFLIKLALSQPTNLTLPF